MKSNAPASVEHNRQQHQSTQPEPQAVEAAFEARPEAAQLKATQAMMGASPYNQNMHSLQAKMSVGAQAKTQQVLQTHMYQSVQPAQLRADGHAFFSAKWSDKTWETYQPPGEPARTSLADVTEEIEDAKKAGDQKKPNALNLARAWMKYAFEKNFGGPGAIEDVYVAKDDQDSGGYSFSQLVSDIPLIVIHAHMEKTHIPAAAGEGEMGPVHWKWKDQPYAAGVGGALAPALYPRLLNIAGARNVRLGQTLKAHSDTELDSNLQPLLHKVLPTTGIADLVAGTLVNRFPSEWKKVETFLTPLESGQIDALKPALFIGKTGQLDQPSDSSRDLLISAQLLMYLAGGRTTEETIRKRNELTALEQTRVEELQPVKPEGGSMELKPMLGKISLQAANNNLNPARLLQIRGVFDRIMGSEVTYNSAAAPMQFIQDVQKARQLDPSAKMGSVFNKFSRSGQDLISTYRAADCVGMAEKVKSELLKLGIHADVIGSNGGNYLNEMPDPSNVGRGRVSVEAAHKYAVYSHASVVVPYVDMNGVPKAIHMESGMGPDPKFFKKYDSLLSAEQSLSKKKYQLDKTVDPKELQKMHIRCKWKMYLSDTHDQARKVFIDLAEGVVFVSKWNDPDSVKALSGTKINFNEVLAAPNKIVTINIKDTDVAMKNIDSLTLFMTTVQKDFGLGDSFVKDMLYLMSNIKEYSEEILLAPINAVRATMAIKTKMIEAKARAIESDEDKAHTAKLAEGQALFEAAVALVEQGNAAGAEKNYTDAYTIFTAIKHDSHITNLAKHRLVAKRAEAIAVKQQVDAKDPIKEKESDYKRAESLMAQGDQLNADGYAKKAVDSFNLAQQVYKNILNWKPKVVAPDDDDPVYSINF